MNRAITYTGLFVATLSLSASGIFVKLAEAPSSITAFYRLFFALMVFVPVVLLNKGHREELARLTKKQWILSVSAGMILAIHYIMWFETLNMTSVASSTVLVSMQPIFTMLLGYMFINEKQTRLALAGCAVALVGSVIIGYGDFRTDIMALMGDILALVACAIISLYFFIGQSVRKNTSATVYSLLGYSGSVIFLGIYAVIKGDPFTGYSGQTWGCFLGLALVSTIMGQFIFNLLLKWLPATMISMSIVGEPVGTCVLAYFILNQRIGFQQAIGIAVILGGLTMYFLSKERNRQVLDGAKEG